MRGSGSKKWSPISGAAAQSRRSSADAADWLARDRELAVRVEIGDAESESIDEALVFGHADEPGAVANESDDAQVNATRGLVYLTFTPLLGVSAVVHRFLYQESPDRSVTVMTIDEALALTLSSPKRVAPPTAA